MFGVKRHSFVFTILPLIVSLAAISPKGSFAQQADPAILEYPQTMLKGIVSAEVARSAGECRGLCEARSGCAGFDHSSTTNMCRLFAAVDSAQQDLSLLAGTRNRIQRYRDPANLPPPPPPPDQEAWHYAQFSGVDLFGRDLVTGGIKIGDWATCARQCESNNACRAFSFNEARDRCFLKSGYEFVQAFEQGVSGLYFKARPSAARVELNAEWDLLLMSDLPGNDLGDPLAQGEVQCMQTCEANERCGGYTWVISGNARRCFLKQVTKLTPRPVSQKTMFSARKINRDMAPDFIRPVTPRD